MLFMLFSEERVRERVEGEGRRGEGGRGLNLPSDPESYL